MENIILIPPCDTYGDVLSIVALSLYLNEYYTNVYILFNNESNKILQHYKHFFKKCDNHIYLVFRSDILQSISSSPYDTYHVVNLYTGNWKHSLDNYKLYGNPKINSKHYYSDTNPFYVNLNIPDKYVHKPNITLPLKIPEVNSIVYYKMVGLNNNVRMDKFNYIRDFAMEQTYYDKIISKYNINGKYNIVNSFKLPTGLINNLDMKHINNDFPCINISNLCEFNGWLCKLIEQSEEIHLVDGTNTMFIYYCQYKNILNINDHKIYYHDYIRPRAWTDFKLHYSVTMISNPLLSNWYII
jgi:hypothetical protein